MHQFERDLDRLRARQKTEMEQKLKQMTADEKRLLKHIKDKHDNDLKTFASDQKAAYKAAKNQFKKVSIVDSRGSIYLALLDCLTALTEACS